MNEEQVSYKVTDRRLFNPDGTPREVPEDERPEVKPEPPAPAATAETAAPAPAAATATDTASARASTVTPSAQVSPDAVPQPPTENAATPAPAADPAADAELPGADDPASFASFMMSIASNAASALGMMEHPVTGKREVDLELGKHWIDVLGMLQQKTRGNLLPQEQQILEGLLADLRMQFVSLTNATPPKTARAYTGRDITGG
jgi:hypothetical protein